MKRVFAAAAALLMMLTLAACDAKLEPLPMGGFVLGCMAAGVVITLASVFLSIRIMEKKEF